MPNQSSDWDLGNLKKLPAKPPSADKIVKIVIYAVIIVAVIVGLRQSVFTINPEEQGVILRFGKYVRPADPGLHFKIPFYIEELYRVPIQRQLKQEFGFRTMTATVQSRYKKEGYQGESLMLTGDLNSADVEWIVQYRITDPLKYLFNVRSVEKTFRDISEATMREIVGDRSVDEVITWGKSEINNSAKEKLQELVDQYETGLEIQVMLLQDVNAPPPVQPSWNEVNEAEQEKDKLLNEAKSKYNSVIPKARGQADRRINEAEGYAVERINEATGQSNKFISVYRQYKLAPEVTRKRYYLETMEKIIPKAGRKYIVDGSNTNLFKLLDLNARGGQQ